MRAGHASLPGHQHISSAVKVSPAVAHHLSAVAACAWCQLQARLNGALQAELAQMRAAAAAQAQRQPAGNLSSAAPAPWPPVGPPTVRRVRFADECAASPTPPPPSAGGDAWVAGVRSHAQPAAAAAPLPVTSAAAAGVAAAPTSLGVCPTLLPALNAHSCLLLCFRPSVGMSHPHDHAPGAT